MNEYISREELIDRLNKTELSADQIRMLVYPKEAVAKAIYDCSSADVRENIHGHWVVGFGSTWCSCSECSHNGSRNWSYCPWCGADMRGDEHER